MEQVQFRADLYERDLEQLAVPRESQQAGMSFSHIQVSSVHFAEKNRPSIGTNPCKTMSNFPVCNQWRSRHDRPLPGHPSVDKIPELLHR